MLSISRKRSVPGLSWIKVMSTILQLWACWDFFFQFLANRYLALVHARLMHFVTDPLIIFKSPSPRTQKLSNCTDIYLQYFLLIYKKKSYYLPPPKCSLMLDLTILNMGGFGFHTGLATNRCIFSFSKWRERLQVKGREKERGREEERICVSFTLGGHFASMQYFLIHVSY